MNPVAASAIGGLTPGGPSGDKAKSIALIIVVVLVAVIIFTAFRKGIGIFDAIGDGATSLLEKLGLKKSAEEKAVDTAAQAADAVAGVANSPFNPTFYKTAPGGTPIFTSSFAKKIAAQIWGSVGVFSDDPEAGLAAIKQCTNWAKVSFVADTFNTVYGRDLYGWLKIKYDTTTQKDYLNKIVAYATSLPKY